MHEKKIKLEDGFEHRFVFQNQNDFQITEQVIIFIEVSKGEWLEDSISIVHGPTERSNQKPEIKALKTSNSNEANIQIIFHKGIRPYVTWMVACRTKNEVPLVKSVEVNGKNILSNKIQKDKNKMARKPSKLAFSSRNLTIGIFMILFAFGVAIFNFDTKHITTIKWEIFSDNFFLWSSLLALLVSIVYGIIAILICTPIKPSIIMGYLDEKDPESTSHWNHPEVNTIAVYK